MSACGCQSGILKYLKPPFANLFHQACAIHDYLYDLALVSRKEADRILLRDCLTIAKANSVLLYPVCLLYYISVRLFGWIYFNYNDILKR